MRYKARGGRGLGRGSAWFGWSVGWFLVVGACLLTVYGLSVGRRVVGAVGRQAINHKKPISGVACRPYVGL